MIGMRWFLPVLLALPGLEGQSPMPCQLPLRGAESSPPTLPEVEVRFDAKIPMRDGTKLAATLYLPRGASGPLPCVLTLTPYLRQTWHDRGMYFASNGYVFASVDVRGRGDSEGAFFPDFQESQDGYDAVEWLAAQPFCNGKVGMWGGSYAGQDQWSTAKALPPHLGTIIPVASSYYGIDAPYLSNIFYSFNVQWLNYIQGHAWQERPFHDSSLWASNYLKLYREHLPFRNLDRISGSPSPIFQEFLKHPAPDAFLDSVNPTPSQYAAMHIPILTLTGLYDDDQPGALEHYRRFMASAHPEDRDRHFLIIGPWDHPGTRTPEPEFDGVKVGPASLVDMNRLHKDWYDWTLKGGSKPAWLMAPVLYYTTGRESWRFAETLEAATGGSRVLYLDSRNGANDVFSSGFLTPVKAAGGTDLYTYDPMDTRPGELTGDLSVPSHVDQRKALLNHGNSLIYHTAPLDQELEIAGFMKLDAYLSLDQPDTDFAVEVFDIAPDGSSLSLGGCLLRARYREDPRKAHLVVPGRIEHYLFDRFPFMARTLPKGHRLRLVIGPNNDPNYEKNYNSGGVVADESGKDARTVRVTLYHDSAHPSALTLPIAAKRQ